MIGITESKLISNPINAFNQEFYAIVINVPTVNEIIMMIEVIIILVIIIYLILYKLFDWKSNILIAPCSCWYTWEWINVLSSSFHWLGNNTLKLHYIGFPASLDYLPIYLTLILLF